MSSYEEKEYQGVNWNKNALCMKGKKLQFVHREALYTTEMRTTTNSALMPYNFLN